MKRIAVLCSIPLLLGGCAMFHRAPPPAPAPVKKTATALGADGRPLVMVDGVPVERVEFRSGVSSATVEKMARELEGCVGGLGAGLVSEPGPVEVYRMACDNGQVFLARCELRQCAPLKR
ncbi:MAG: hypothetical protein ACXU8N_08395 [Telluria sp.]